MRERAVLVAHVFKMLDFIEPVQTMSCRGLTKTIARAEAEGNAAQWVSTNVHRAPL